MNVKGKFKAVSKVAVVAAAGLLLATASPAAAEPGAGISTGSTNVSVSHTIEFPLCLKATAATITLNNTGSFSAAGVGGVYVGGTTTTVTATTDYYFSPAGLFSDAMCTIPTAVPVSVSVAHTAVHTVGTTVSCTGTGVYSRVNTNAEVTTAAGTSSCTVNGTSALSAVLTFAGSQQPCLGDFPVPDPCATAPEWVGTYTQA